MRQPPWRSSCSPQEPSTWHPPRRLPDPCGLSEFGTAYGLTKLGIENVGGLFTRGVLLDVARYKGVERLDPTYIITIEDIEGTLELQGIDEIRAGDAVLFHTGWGQLSPAQRARREIRSPSAEKAV